MKDVGVIILAKIVQLDIIDEIIIVIAVPVVMNASRIKLLQNVHFAKRVMLENLVPLTKRFVVIVWNDMA
jgi:hypothetical protein